MERVRAIAAQILCKLARSDLEARLLVDFPALFAVTRGPRFVTARHTLRARWQVGAAGTPQRVLLFAMLEGRFHDCAPEENATLIRYDIVESLRRVYDAGGDEAVRALAWRLIEAEDDAPCRRKYVSRWKGT